MPKDPKYLAWIDLETTGTDEHLDPILEIALIVTTPDLESVVAVQTVICPTIQAWKRLEENELVANMHQTSGLIDELPNGVPCSKAESLMIETLNLFGKAQDFMLAGSGVGHFDRRFLRFQMSKLEAMFQYPNMDIGVIRRFLHLIGRDDLVRPEPENKAHRAMVDIQDHLEEAQFYSREFQNIEATP